MAVDPRAFLFGAVAATGMILASSACLEPPSAVRSTAEATAQTPTFDSIVAGARDEGRVVVVVGSPGDWESHVTLAEAFNKRFGLDIAVEWLPHNPTHTNTRLLVEQGRTAGFIDIVGSGGLPEIAVVTEPGIVTSWPWVEVFGGHLADIASVVDVAPVEIRGSALPIGDAAYGLAWNPDLINEDELPATYEELTAEKWRGRFSVNALGLYPLEFWSSVKGHEGTLDFARRITANDPVLERGTGAATRAVSVGQAPVGITSYHQSARVDNVNFKFFDDYIPLTSLYIYVPKSAPHPNAARVFSAWLVTEGIDVLDEHDRMPRIIDNGTDLHALYTEQKAATGVAVLSEQTIEDANRGKELRDEISTMMAQ